MRRDESSPLEHSRRSPASSGRTIDWSALSDAVLPQAIRCRAIDVTISTDRDEYRLGEPVSIDVTLENRLPVPIRLRTDSPERWYWAVDGHPAASCHPRGIPDRPSTIAFARGERKRFRRRWSQRLRVDEREWQPVGPGRYVLEAKIARDDAEARGLIGRCTVEICEPRLV
ncbi:hypothetical protein [Natrarchaeobaculum sulfurireducens]|uniref:DUF7974 domain-containing protein n=1 Tax=Natrarchaeobaculum sulfurireducens TaxID=2044521 RepID=A0A346PND3_9EURY|nr:hypothetical protein [Natrarchaeobaculum sulfurireducens]AXR78926.1 hypothetical protein AArc1_2613 [Natrarchaeobaculum sulfurireducens]AXR81028.1 hypothetical protein AArcMg_1010 [Natrarchaeobaculum sulfurireducens]